MDKIKASHFFRSSLAGVILSAALLLGFHFTTEGRFSPQTYRLLRILMGVVLYHQFLVWLVWRAQLCFNLFTRLFGKYDLLIWSLLFLPPLAARPVLTVLIALSDRATLPGAAALWVFLALLLLIPSLYGSYSVARYFGIIRAVGADHFRESYRSMPLASGGMYRWSNNVMYGYVFLLFWAIALIFRSQAALVAALFQHAFVWVHYYTVESPDMDAIYG
ncbi:MAG: methyltransferase [Spirochaetales bacterium]|nr:methyltransferase [Spirochaetales bacterium]